MQLVERKSGLQVWVYRWFEKDQAGEPWRRKRALGAITRFKSETAAGGKGNVFAWADHGRIRSAQSEGAGGPLHAEGTRTEPGKERRPSPQMKPTDSC